MNDILFQPFKIKNMELRNRFVMSAAADNLSNKPDARIKRFSELAAGGIGLIIAGAMRLPEIEQQGSLVEAVHKNNGKLAIQIVTTPGVGISPWSDPKKESIAASKLPEEHIFFNKLIKYGKHHEATDEEIKEIINTYAKSAAAAKKIGADAIQIHAAHHNFLSQFLSPLTNKRTDKWGGSIENRTRIHREIIKAIRAEIGSDFPVLIKLGVEDGFKDGLKFSEGKKAAKIIAESEYDVLEISQGLQDLRPALDSNDWSCTPMHTEINSISEEAYFRNWCREIKKSISKPTIMTGGLRSYELIKEIVQTQETDLIGMCRPFIREAALINRWKSGDHKKASCISCNKCITELLAKGQPLACYLDLP